MSVNIIVELPWNNHWKEREYTKRIIQHHIEAEFATIHDIERWHKVDNGWIGGCGYHFYVRKDGSIYQGRRMDMIGAHAQCCNDDSIGIAYEGNFDIEDMAENQVKSGIELIKYILSKYPGLKNSRHKDVNNTECPGINFDGRLLKVTTNKVKGVDYIMYKDEGKISEYAKEAVKALNEKGIMKGDTDDNFRPKDSISREDAAVIVYKALKSLGA